MVKNETAPEGAVSQAKPRRTEPYQTAPNHASPNRAKPRLTKPYPTKMIFIPTATSASKGL